MSKKLKIVFSVIIFAVALLIANTAHADDTETLTYDNLNYYVGDNGCVITSLKDNTVTELTIPATIGENDVYGFEDSDILVNATNLKTLTIGKAYYKFLATTTSVSESSIETINVEQKIFKYTGETYTFLTSFDTGKVTICGYGHTRLQDNVEEAGFTYESLGENTEQFVYSDEECTKALYLNVCEPDIVVPASVTELRFLGGINVTFSGANMVDYCSCVETITFEGKIAIKVYDGSYLTSLKTVYAYEGTGADIFADNQDVEFISLGELDEELSFYNYEIVEDEEGDYVDIKGVNMTVPSEIEIPSEIEGLPVKRLSCIAGQPDYYRVWTVEKIVIPASVEYIGNSFGCYFKEVYIYGTNVEVDETYFLCFLSGWNVVTGGLYVYAYDESGLEAIVGSRFVSLNSLVEYTTQETEEVTVDGETVTVMPIDTKTNIEDFLNEDNFPVIATYTVKVLDASGEEKDSTEKLGSRNVIQITDEDGTVLQEYTVIVSGDVSGNGYARMYDAFQILKDSVLNGEIDDIDVLIRDYNDDGYVRMYDAFQFLKDAVLGS